MIVSEKKQGMDFLRNKKRIVYVLVLIVTTAVLIIWIFSLESRRYLDAEQALNHFVATYNRTAQYKLQSNDGTQSPSDRSGESESESRIYSVNGVDVFLSYDSSEDELIIGYLFGTKEEYDEYSDALKAPVR